VQKPFGRVHVAFHHYQLSLGGAPTEEEALSDYLRQRMQKAVRHLSATADVFTEVLIEIMEIQEGVDDGMQC
jgi:hypothetical protein